MYIRHEGRTWYHQHRGRLWIAATSRVPDKFDIEEVENECKQRLGGKCKVVLNIKINIMKSEWWFLLWTEMIVEINVMNRDDGGD